MWFRQVGPVRLRKVCPTLRAARKLWRLDGALEDLSVFFRTGLAVADSGDWPEWSKDSEFRAVRERSRGAAKD
jgi:hypothetical protein